MTRNHLLLASSAAALAIFANPASAGEVIGMVVDATDTVALQSANVRIDELAREAVTERDGSFRFPDVPAGTYTLVARYVGAPSQTLQVTVPAEGAVRADFSLGGNDASAILVIGQSANQASALSRKREADGVSDVLSRDAIGQFPDQNVAESLRRLPGINVLNDQGEGRFVSVRGLDPELNSTSLNGVRLPAPESDVRSVALDVISSDIIESVEVKKSLTPDMDADTIGASIEINTTSAFDRKKDLLSLNLEGSYNDYAGVVSPKGSIDFSKKLSDDFGVAGGISYYKRKFETDNIETGAFWDQTDDGVVYNEEFQYRDYDVTRERISAALSFDYRVSDTTTAYARGNWSQFDDQEYRRRTTIIFDEEPASGTDDSAFFTDADGRIEVRRDTKDRFERQRIRSLVIGSDTDTGIWKFNWSASWAKSTEYENGSLDPTRFRARFDGDGVDVNMDFSDPRVALYTVTSGADLFNDPSEYSFNRIERTDLSDSQDEEYAVRADLARTFATDGGDFTLQGGVKSRWRDKSYNFNLTYYDGYDGDYTLADVLGEQTYRLTDIGPVSSKTGPTEFFEANQGSFEINEYESALGSAIDDYSVSEDILAGYLLGRWDSTTLRAIGGVRVEQTKNELNGNLVLSDEDEETVTVTPVSYDRKYTDWLPSLTLRFSPESDLVFRAAASKSLVRPKLSKLAPRYSINEDDEAEFGNPDLLPYKAWNLDASAEYYMSSNGGISVGVFYKDVKDFIVDATIDEPGVFNGVSYSEATIPVNGRSAEIFGVEASFSQSFTMLPAPFDGLLFQANYSYTDATGSVPEGDFTSVAEIDSYRDIMLPSSSKHTFNLTLGYEKGPINLRVAGTYRSKYLDEIGASAEEDRYVDNHFQIDLSAKYKVTDQVRLFAEWVNVNNAKYFAYQNFESSQRLLQYEEYGSTVKFGAKASF